MRRIILNSTLVALTACASMPVVVSPADSDPLRRAVVADVTKLIVSEFDMTVSAFDPASEQGALRSALLASLRAAGFRIGAGYQGALRFDCEVVSLGNRQYLVRVVLGDQRISRLWVADTKVAYQAGSWTRSR